jgi:hypothetical protein
MEPDVPCQSVDERRAEGSSIHGAFLGLVGAEVEAMQVRKKAFGKFEFNATRYAYRRLGQEKHRQRGSGVCVRFHEIPTVPGRRP